MKDIIAKIKDSKLRGRGGAAFYVHLKWQAFLDNIAKQNGYIVVNCAEGEPNLKKDLYVLKNSLNNLLLGLNTALKYFNFKKIIKVYFFIRQDYYNKHKSEFAKILNLKEYALLKNKLEFFIKPDKNDYIAGEETAMLNIIEGNKSQPRLKPPFPPERGLFDKPTLIHNVESWSSIGEIVKGNYKKERIYHLRGDIFRPGLYKLSEDLNASEILQKTNNLPKFRYFAQIGGDACGKIVLDRDMNKPACGSGSITLYRLEKKVIDNFLKNILEFHYKQSCGQCVPCREGTYRLFEEYQNNQFNNYSDLIYALQETSLCAFGTTLANLLDSFEKIRKE